MGSLNRRKRSIRRTKRMAQHKISIIAVSCVIVMLTGILSIASVSLIKKKENYLAQEAKLEEQILQEDERAQEIEELEVYFGTDEYVEDVAKEKLGLIYPNEIIFKAKE